MSISAVCLGLQFEPFASLSAWRYDLIPTGQWLRILTGNFSHTNFPHLAMNLGGLWIIAFIFRPRPQEFLILTLLISIGVGAGMLLSDVQSYVGLSGTLHGLFAYYALKEALQGRNSSWLLLFGVMGKVVWELTIGPSHSSMEMIEANVAVEAHLCGVVSGIVYALVFYPLYKNTCGSQSIGSN